MRMPAGPVLTRAEPLGGNGQTNHSIPRGGEFNSRSNQQSRSQSTAQRNHGNVAGFKALVKLMARLVGRVLDLAELCALLLGQIRHARGPHLLLVHGCRVVRQSC